MVDIPNDTPLEKIKFPFSNRYQLQIVSLLGVGLCPPPLLSAGILSGLNCVLSQSEFIYASVLLYLDDAVPSSIFCPEVQPMQLTS